MKKLIKGISVDAGMIMISDINYYKKYEKRSYIDSNLSKIIKIKLGDYKVNWNIDNTWNGNISGSGIIKIDSGKMIISDPCYCIGNDKWDDWLDETDFGLYEPKNCILINNMGGDGTYNIHLDIKEFIANEI